MSDILAHIGGIELALAGAIALLAGFVKGVVGFAMPLIMISLMGTFLPPDLALVGLMLPTLLSNALQALRDGAAAAWDGLRSFAPFLVTGAVALIITAQLYVLLPLAVLFLAIGLPVTLYASLQIAGWRLEFRRRQLRVDMAFGATAGAIGGLSGVWGPAMVTYLTALNTEKKLQMRVQGASYGLGAALLMASHIPTGVVDWASLSFSLYLCGPALVGLFLGQRIQDKINQDVFRTVTLWVLLLAGINLIRRAVFVV